MTLYRGCSFKDSLAKDSVTSCLAVELHIFRSPITENQHEFVSVDFNTFLQLFEF